MAPSKQDKSEHSFDVIIIGAGLSGINFAYRLQERCPHLSYAILENRHEIGGTWSLFTFPDTDLHSFGLPWRPWPYTETVAQGPLIKSYLKDSAAQYGIDKKIQFHHHVDAASYSSVDHTWTFNVTANGKQKKVYKSRWFQLCMGYYNYDKALASRIPGIDDFQGEVIHPQFWPNDFDSTDKEIVVVGSGATAVTMIPHLAKTSRHVTMLQRSPSYVLALPQSNPADDSIRWWFSWFPRIRMWLMRWKYILFGLYGVRQALKYPVQARQFLTVQMEKLLPASVPVDPHFAPKYDPWEQRLCMCPNGDFFESLRSGKASVETGVIDTVTKNSIQLASGKTLHPDVIVTATGLQMRFDGGMKISVDGKKYNMGDHFVWKGVMLEDLPNASWTVGYVDTPWTLGADATAQTVTRILNKMKSERVTEVRAIMSKSEKEEVKELPMFRMSSKYFAEGQAATPKGGDRGPWLPRKNFLKDIWTAWYGDIKTGTQWVKT